LQRRVVAGHGGAQRAPADAIPRLIQATQRAAQPSDAREKIRNGNFAIGERETGGDGSAQRPLAVDVPRLEARRAFLNEKAAHFFVLAFGPDDGNVGEGAVGDPHFFAVEDVLAAFLDGAREHPAGVGAELRLGEAEAANGFAFLEQWEPFIFLGLASIGVNRVHHQAGLDGDETAQAGIAALEFLVHQAVGNVRHFRAAVALEVRAEKAEFTQLRHKLHRESSFAAVFFDDGENFVVDELASSLANKFFFVVEQGVKLDEVDAGE